MGINKRVVPKQVLALASAVALASSGLLLGGVVGASAAHAAGQTINITPAGPYKGGEVVVVTVKGFSPNAPVAIGLCKQGRVATGPGDCAASKTGGSRLIQANAQGVGTGKITILVGPIGNSKPPFDSCGPKNPCYIGAANITNGKEEVQTNIKYVGATSPSPTPTSTATSIPSPTKKPLPHTGPMQDAVKSGLVGLVAVQVGLILAVRAVRASPRRVHSH